MSNLFISLTLVPRTVADIYVVSGQRILIERIKNEWILDQIPSTIPKLVGDKDVLILH